MHSNKRREPVEDFLESEEFRQGPASVTEAGQITRRLMRVLLELFHVLRIPVILVFDQLEDSLGSVGEERNRDLRLDFGRAVTTLINSIPGLCLMLFVERHLWDAILLGMDPYIRARLDQDFNLPGRPAEREIRMPENVGRPILVQLIQRRSPVSPARLRCHGLARGFSLRRGTSSAG